MNDAQLIEHLHARGWSLDKIDVAMIREACAAVALQHDQKTFAGYLAGIAETWVDMCLKEGKDWRPALASVIERRMWLAPTSAPAVGAAQDAACEHCNGTGQVFGHAENCEDDLCALNGDEHSCGGRIEPCSCTAAPAPDIPAGCEMARGWAVEVSAQGERVLLISEVGYSGLTSRIEPLEKIAMNLAKDEDRAVLIREATDIEGYTESKDVKAFCRSVRTFLGGQS